LNKSLPELLAPAGTPEAAWAALAYGADAVYAGLPRFSARAEAGNFSAEALDELIGYAHHLGRRVFITFNTLVQQRELDAALETLALIRDLNADGVIVQDMGVVRLIQKNFPQLRLHASTQLAVHNLAGAKQLASLGFKRVVLARELSLKEIAHIGRSCGIETETFIHGALCYSYSGLCLFSSHLLGRSGNRGRCAYCCRQPFHDGDGKETLPFSMKDFSAAGRLPELLDAGVAALKIEGRMKSPLYVAAVTDFYRSQISNIEQGTAECRRNNNPLRGGVPDGWGGFSVSASDDLEARLSDIQTIFGRPSTDLYLEDSETSPVDPVNDGHRGAFIGTVKAVAGSWLILHSNRALQKHDGLKVEMAGETSAFGFAADEMRLASDLESKRRFELPADADIALKLPADAPRLEKGAAVYCSYSQAVRQRYKFTAPRPGQFRQRKPVNIHIIQTLEEMKFVASADGIQTEMVLSGPFEPARQPEKSAAAIRQCFEKLGDTDWKLGELTIEGSVFVPVSVLNDARRRLISDFSELWKQNPPRPAGTPPAEGILNVPLHGRGGRREVTDGEGRICWSVKSRVFQALEHIGEFVLEIDPSRPEEIEKAQAFYADKLRLALPVIIREDEAAAFRESIAALPDQRKWEAANVGGLNLLQGKPDITADWPLYTMNSQAALQWRDQGVGQFVLSPEDDTENLYALIEQLGDAAIVPVYQYTPLMISATKPAASGDELIDRSRRAFRVEQSGREFVVTNETPFSLAGHLNELKAKGASRFRMDFSYGIDSAAEAAEIVQQIISGVAVSGHTGNFSRGLQ
jgi:putative protease